jgi:UPF0755 protein
MSIRGGRRADDVADVDVLETYDWKEDPWDASLGVAEVEPVSGGSRIGRWVGFAVIALATMLILAGGVYGWWYIREANPPGEPGPIVQFVVAEGDTLQSVSERLEDEGIVKGAGFFRTYVGDNGGLESIEPGLYLLRPGDHVGNILGRLRTSPSEATTRITFPEGFTLQQMANRLANSEELPQFSAEAFMQFANDPSIASTFRPPGVASLEGLLFPATYEVSNADTERQVIERMVAEMERVGGQLGITAPDMPGYTPYEILTIASMVEREAKTDEDRALISRVIYNRLAAGMRLQIDATALYGAPPEMLPPNVEDIDIDALVALDTPWNTYFRDRLPPTPIANPGRAALDAALNPAPDLSPGNALCTDVPAEECHYYFYVVSDDQGNHAFAVTAEQHQQNVDAARAAGLLGD